MDSRFLAQLLTRIFAVFFGGVLTKLGYDAAESAEFFSALGMFAAAGVLTLITAAWAYVERKSAMDKASHEGKSE